MTPTEEKGRRARAILQDPIFIEAFATVEKDIWETLKSTKLEDTALRNQLYCMIKGLEQVAAALNAHVIQLQVESKRSGVSDQP